MRSKKDTQETPSRGTAWRDGSNAIYLQMCRTDERGEAPQGLHPGSGLHPPPQLPFRLPKARAQMNKHSVNSKQEHAV